MSETITTADAAPAGERWWSAALVDALLAEDVPFGDLTTSLLGISAAPARLAMSVRAETTLCGVDLASDLLRRAGARVQVLATSGTRLAAGTAILEAEGPAGALHRGWKVSQTLIEYLSGIATATADIVAAARTVAPDIAVVTTRKTFPGSKAMMIAAIRAGGALPHRLSLSETVLVFPEHQVFLADPVAAIASLRRAAPEKKIVVEVTRLDEARALLPAAPDVLQCEKMTPDALSEVVALVRDQAPSVLIAAAGGVNAGNAAAYARAGADLLVTSAPYWAKPSDVKVVILPA